MQVPLNDLSTRIHNHETQLKDALNRVLQSGWVVLGEELLDFEKSFARYLGVKYCIGVANGTDAIELGLRALGVKAGDLVATVANAGGYATSAILAIGAIPFYMDVNPTTKNVPLHEVQRAALESCRAIVVTHLYGLAVEEIDEIARFCKGQGIPLLEDCAQAHGARRNGKYVGSFGDVASFSFYPTKNLGALGDGGAVVTSSDSIAERLAALRQYGWAQKYCIELPGGRNSRLDEMQAAVLKVFLPYLEEANNKRRQIAVAYQQGIQHPQVMLPVVGADDNVAHLFVIQTAQRQSLRAHLASCGVGSDIHYPVPDHRQPFLGQQFALTVLPHTEKLADEVLSLPCYPEMTQQQVKHVIESVNSWLA